MTSQKRSGSSLQRITKALSKKVQDLQGLATDFEKGTQVLKAAGPPYWTSEDDEQASQILGTIHVLKSHRKQEEQYTLNLLRSLVSNTTRFAIKHPGSGIDPSKFPKANLSPSSAQMLNGPLVIKPKNNPFTKAPMSPDDSSSNSPHDGTEHIRWVRKLKRPRRSMSPSRNESKGAFERDSTTPGHQSKKIKLHKNCKSVVRKKKSEQLAFLGTPPLEPSGKE